MPQQPESQPRQSGGTQLIVGPGGGPGGGGWIEAPLKGIGIQDSGVVGLSEKNHGVAAQSASSGFAGVYGYNDQPNSYGVMGQNLGSAGGTAGVLGVSDLSVGTPPDRGTGVWGASQTGYGVYGTSVDKGAGVAGHGQGAPGVTGSSVRGHGVHGTNGDGSGLPPIYGAGVWGESDFGFGVYGASKTNPGVQGLSAGLDGVHGESQSSQHAGVSGANNSGTGVNGSSGSGAGVAGSSVSGRGVYGSSQSGDAGVFDGTVRVNGECFVTGQLSALGPLNTLGAVRIGGDLTTQGNVTVQGNVTTNGDIFLTNADCAEDFDVPPGESNGVEPGTVMVIGDESLLRPSARPYDKRVAGVISGAGSCKPGIVLDKQTSPGQRMPLALMGKVYCKVDAQYAPIRVGDLLTTSPTPGHAMKATDPRRAFGAVIGKALRQLGDGRGLIPILIALQ